MAKRQIATKATEVRDGHSSKEEIEAFAKSQGWSTGFASLFLRLRRINKAVREIQVDGSPQEMSRFMNGRRIETRR